MESKIFCILALLIVSIMPQIISNKSLGTDASSLHGGNDKPSVVGASFIMKDEIWLSISGYGGLYQVSSLGRIKRLASSVRRAPGGFSQLKERVLTNEGKRRYRSFTLCFKGVRESCLAHRLVATAFLPNPENKPCVNHIDGDPTNNAVSNLEWVTYSENELHSVRLLGKTVNLANLINYDKSWETAISVNGYNIRGAARKKAYELLMLGVTTDDLPVHKITLSSFYKLVSFLRKYGVVINTARINNINNKVKYIIV